jgi:hypothetical protein
METGPGAVGKEKPVTGVEEAGMPVDMFLLNMYWIASNPPLCKTYKTRMINAASRINAPIRLLVDFSMV